MQTPRVYLQDVIRLILFVSISEFSEIEATAPGIVSAASDLLPEILIAATQQPRLGAARLDHSVQWHDLRQAVEAESGGRPRGAGSGKAKARCATPAAAYTPHVPLVAPTSNSPYRESAVAWRVRRGATWNAACRSLGFVRHGCSCGIVPPNI